MGEVAQEFARLRGKCTLSNGEETSMPPTNTTFEQIMYSREAHWVQLGNLLPGREGGAYGVAAGHPLPHRSAAALKLIRNHEAVIRDVCNPFPDQNVVGVALTQTHLQRVSLQHVEFAEEALRLVALKLLGVTDASNITPVLNRANPVQAQVWAATAMFVMARLHLGEEKPGRTPGCSNILQNEGLVGLSAQFMV